TMPLTGPQRVPAGTVALEVRAPSYLPVIRTVTVAARGQAREPIVLVASVDATPRAGSAAAGAASPREARPTATAILPAPVDNEPSRAEHGAAWSGRRKVGAGFLAGGVGALAAGITFHLIRESRAQDF